MEQQSGCGAQRGDHDSDDGSVDGSGEVKTATDYDDSDHRHDVTTAINQLKLTVTVTTMKSRDLTELRNMVLYYLW